MCINMNVTYCCIKMIIQFLHNVLNKNFHLLGSLLVKKLGKLSELSACNGKLFPVGYE